MENKLVFEPTTLTQYEWYKYDLLTNYTYYWQVFNAIEIYKHRYSWGKYEILPATMYSWDKYETIAEEKRKYYWQRYSTKNVPYYIYRREQNHQENKHTFYWNRYETNYLYNYKTVGANHCYKYNIKKYPAVDSQTSQTYYYYDRYFAFPPSGYNYATTYNFYYCLPEYYEYFKISPKQKKVIESISPELPTYFPSRKIAIYNFRLHSNTISRLEYFNDNTTRTHYPYGSPDIESNTVGFEFAFHYENNEANNEFWFIKDTDGNCYALTHWSYYNFDDGLVYFVIPITVTQIQSSSNVKSISLSRHNFSDGYIREGYSPVSEWPGYVIVNGTDKALPVASCGELNKPDSYKRILTQKRNSIYSAQYRVREPLIYNSNNQWVANSAYPNYYEIDYCYKIETVSKEKDVSTFTEDILYSHYKPSNDTRYTDIYNRQDEIFSYYDTTEDVWVEIDTTDWEDTAIPARRNHWYNLNFYFDDLSSLTQLDVDNSVSYSGSWHTGAVIPVYSSEGWVDKTDTLTIVTKVVTARVEANPQPAPEDYYPLDGRENGYHYIYTRTNTTLIFVKDDILYGNETGSYSFLDTNEITYINNIPYTWRFIRTEYRKGKDEYIDTVSSFEFEYPFDGVDGNYFYSYLNSQIEETGNRLKDAYIGEVVSSSSQTYPQNGVQDNYWYDYYGEVSTEYKYIYSKDTTFKKYKLDWVLHIPKNNPVDVVTYDVCENKAINPRYSFYWLYPYTFGRTVDTGGLVLSEPERRRYPDFEYVRTEEKYTAKTYDRYTLMSYPESVIALPADLNDTVPFDTSNSYFFTISGTPEENGMYDGFQLAKAVRKYGEHISGTTNMLGLQYLYNPDELEFFGDVTYNSTYPYYYALIDLNQSYTSPSGNEVYTFRGDNDTILTGLGYIYRRTELNEHMGYALEYIDEVSSYNETEYPNDGELDNYYYIYSGSQSFVSGYVKGEQLADVTSDNGEAYVRDGVDVSTLKWYVYSHSVPQYHKGNYLGTVTSFIETAYPHNNYVINDAWYSYSSSRDVIVGETEINASQLMGGVNYTQEINPSEDLMIGAGGAAQVDFTIYAPDANAATQYLGKDFTYYVKMTSDSDWRQIGIFTLTKAELPDKQTAKIEGFDYIYKFDTVIDGWLDSLHFPMTLGNLFNSLCQYVGCEAYSTEFNNSTFIVNDNFEAVQITGRTILQYITEVSGGFCVAEPDGRIHIKQYSIPPTGTINLGNDSYVKYTHEIYNVPVITSVVVRKDDEDEGVESNV